MKLFFRPGTWPDSTNRRIFRAAVIVGALTVLAKVGTAVKDLLVARYFGRSDSLDAFLIAYLVPSFAMSLAMGALVVAFVPVFVKVRQKEGLDSAQKLFSSMMFLTAMVLVPVVILLALLAPYYLPYLGSSFSAAKLRLTRELLYLLLPFVLFGGGAAFVSAVLNAGERFALAAATPLVTPLVIIGFLELGPERWGAFSLAAGVVLGSFLEAVLVLRALKSHGLQPTILWNGLDANLRSVLSQCAPMLAGSFLMCGTGVVDQSMAAMLTGGSVAALSYGNKIVTGFLAVGAVAMSTAVLPYFSKMAAENDWNGCRHTLKRYSTLLALVTVPSTALLMVFSKPLVRLLFQRGAFTSADTDLVSWIQICYAIQIPFYICSILFVRFLSAIRRNDLVMYGAVINLVLDIVLNVVLMKVLGIAGIALSTSIVLMVSFLFLSTWSIRLLAGERFTALNVVGVERNAQ
ncbi:MAG TPA: murein biosynthesis integral membrane protein MurJ [Candidatus Angelobacter sp.]|nr:murein biosynthesis integral membrane protein MurJ [Candidatus Angelobacter sp.]